MPLRSRSPSPAEVKPVGSDVESPSSKACARPSLGLHEKASPLYRILLGILVSYAFMKVFHDPFCGFTLGCGCSWTWAGGWANCNVHNKDGPRCPWCVAFVDGDKWYAGPATSTSRPASQVPGVRRNR